MSPEPSAAVPVPARVRARSSLAWLALTAFLLTWFVLFRPQSLGGRVDYVMVAGTSMLPTNRDGDLAVVRKQPSYRRGDIIAYRVPAGRLAAGQKVIHRIVGGSTTTGYLLQGDNKQTPDEWRPKPSDVIGKEWFAIPRAGKLLWLLRSPLLLASLAAGLVLAFLLVGGAREAKPGSDG
jgi:signal peptidase I